MSNYQLIIINFFSPRSQTQFGNEEMDHLLIVNC